MDRSSTIPGPRLARGAVAVSAGPQGHPVEGSLAIRIDAFGGDEAKRIQAHRDINRQGREEGHADSQRYRDRALGRRLPSRDAEVAGPGRFVAGAFQLKGFADFDRDFGAAPSGLAATPVTA